MTRRVVGLIVLYTGLLSWLTLTRHARCMSGCFDLGIHDQSLWLMAQGMPPNLTTRGVHLLADHFQPISYLFVPIYWLPHPDRWLLVVQALWFGLGAWPAFRLAKARKLTDNVAVAFSLAYLCQPALQYTNTFEFHFNALQTTPLMFALYFLERERPGPYVCSLLIALGCSEMTGLILIALSWNAARLRDRRWAIATLALGGVGLFAARLTMARFNQGGESAYLNLFAHLGATPGAILSYLLTHPQELIWHLIQPSVLLSGLILLLPYAFLPLGGLPQLIPAVPIILGNVLSWRDSQHSVTYHYSASLLPFLYWSALYGWERYRVEPRRLMAVALLSCLAGPFVMKPLPPKREAMLAALKDIPSSAAVSADNLLAAHLTQRLSVYMFPNPFVEGAWGNRIQAIVEQSSKEFPPADPAAFRRGLEASSIDWVVLESEPQNWPLFEADRQYYFCALQASGQFESIYRAGVTLLRRTAVAAQPPCPDAQPHLCDDGSKLVFSRGGKVFLSDLSRQTRQTLVDGNGSSFQARLSPNGARVVFASEASDLVPGDSNSVVDVIVQELSGGTRWRVPTPRTSQGRGSSFLPTFSPDGDKIAFVSYALGSAWGRGLLTYSRLSGQTVVLGGDERSLTIGRPSFSREGVAQCAFLRQAAALGQSPLTGELCLAEADGVRAYLEPGTHLRLLVNGVAPFLGANDDCYEPALSRDGRFLVFSSYASNLVKDDQNRTSDIFCLDRKTGHLQLLSRTRKGLPANGPSYSPTISADGSRVAFVSLATDLVEKTGEIIYVWERGTEEISPAP